MNDDRFQYQPWYIKLWRLRYYIPIPLYTLISKIRRPHAPWRLLWSINIGLAQIPMKWYYTWKETKEHLERKKK